VRIRCFAGLVIVLLCHCASTSAVPKECGNPVLEGNLRISLDGEAVHSPRSFTLKTTDGRPVEVTLANFGGPFTPMPAKPFAGSLRARESPC